MALVLLSLDKNGNYDYVLKSNTCCNFGYINLEYK